MNPSTFRGGPADGHTILWAPDRPVVYVRVAQGGLVFRARPADGFARYRSTGDTFHYDETPRGLVRHSDPDTSHDAANRITGRTERTLLRTLQDRECTADELCRLLPTVYPPTLKSALSRLQRHRLIIDTGQRRLSDRGVPMIVWTLATPRLAPEVPVPEQENPPPPTPSALPPPPPPTSPPPSPPSPTPSPTSASR